MDNSASDSRAVNPPSGDAPPRMLSARAAEVVTAVLADLTAAEVPLAEGLRAAAGEAADRRVEAELAWLAGQVEAGHALDEVLTSRHSGYPGYAGGLVRAALRTGRLGEALLELTAAQRTLRDIGWSVRAALAYPLLLLGIAVTIGLIFVVILVGPLVDLLAGFELELPSVTQSLFWLRETGVRWAFILAGVALAAAGLFRLAGGAARWRRVVCTLPLVGPLWQWSGVAELARLLAVLVEQGVPLPEALRLAAGALRDANLREVSLGWADEVEQGGRLSERIAVSPRVPASLCPVVRWGEQSGQLDEAFRVAADMFEGRVQMRAELLRTVLPPMIFVAVAAGVLLLMLGLLLPIFSMIRWLQ